MKKIFLGAILIGLLAACGGAKDSYNYNEKVELSKKIMKSDQKAIKEYEEVMKKITEQVNKGDEKAMTEAQEWAKALAEVQGIKLPEVSTD